MRTIWKYDVPVDDDVHGRCIPGNIVHVACQQPDIVSVWAEIDTIVDIANVRKFTVIGTGHDVPERGQYIGTALAASGALVWHLYEILS